MIKIVHAPHTSKYIPKEFLSDYKISLDRLEYLNEIYHDKYVDELVKDLECVNILKFEYSRLFCDVERFNHITEEMNQYGRGVLYTHDHNFDLIREVKNEKPIIDIYNNHHKKLDDVVEKHLKKGKVLIIDLHSYSDELLIEKDDNLPDLCIGIDYFHYDGDVLSKILNIFKNENIIYNINYPYSGSIVPIKYYNKDNNVISIMLDFKKDFLENNIEKIKKIIKCITEI